MEYQRSRLDIECVIAICDYFNDASNSVFVTTVYRELRATSIKTVDRAKCRECVIDTQNILTWMTGGIGHVQSTNCFDCSSRCESITWPSVNISCDRCTNDEVWVKVFITLPEMLLNIRTTPLGKFCCSCRTQPAATNYDKVGVCEKCNDHLCKYINLWWNINSVCATIGMPCEIPRYAYQLAL